MAKKFDVQYYFSEGFHSIFTHGFMSFAAVCMIVACLLIMGSFTLVAVNLDDMLGDLEAENEFLAYVDESYTEEQAKAQGIDYMVGKFPMSANGKALILNGGEGLVKIIAGREYGEVLGMHIIGPRATDLICEGALAIGSELTLDELAATIHSHPTVTETMRECALDALGRAVHIPPRRK